MQDVVPSASNIIIFLEPEYTEHKWKDTTADGIITNHNLKGDSRYGAGVYTHPKVRHEGIGTMLYDARKKLVKTLILRRMISGARLFNYCEPASKLARLEFAEKVIKGEIHDPVLSFDVDNGFKIIKILPNYLQDVRTLNNASFREWLNLEYHQDQ